MTVQAHAYFKGIDFEALLRREIAMKAEWIPVISGDHDGSMFDPKTLKMVRYPFCLRFTLTHLLTPLRTLMPRNLRELRWAASRMSLTVSLLLTTLPWARKRKRCLCLWWMRVIRMAIHDVADSCTAVNTQKISKLALATMTILSTVPTSTKE